MFTAFSSKPKTVDSILAGFTQMLNDLGEVVRSTGAKIEDCTKRISDIEAEKSAAQAIIFDVDGVLLDWGTSFLRWLHLSKGVVPEVDPVGQASYNIAKSLFPSRAREQVIGWIEEFSLTDRYASLLAYDGAIIEMIKIRDLRVLPMGGSKLDVFREFAPKSFVIEDALHHLVDAQGLADHIPFIFDQPYNRSNTTYPRLFGWPGAAERLLHLSPRSNYHSMKAA